MNAKGFKFDSKGLGVSELTYLALSRPGWFILVFWMVQKGLGSLALKLARWLV
jgi:hypothetical protein